MAAPILQDQLRFAPWMVEKSRRLPGVMPLDIADWLQVDEAYSAQLAEKARLITVAEAAVHQLADTARPAAEELLRTCLDALDNRDDFGVSGQEVIRPDGVSVQIDAAAPLLTLSQLLQEDLVIMQKQGNEHVLTGALLCFPASWTLAEKFMKPLVAIHDPVAEYDDNIARRVQRLFDMIRVDQPMWRANALFYEDATLHQPRPENAPRDRSSRARPFVRSERQSLLRLPETDAVVFTIHTTVIRRENLSVEQAEGLKHWPIEAVSA